MNDDHEMPTGTNVVAWLGLGTVAYVALGLLGRATIPDGEVLSLVWPADGVAMFADEGIGIPADQRERVFEAFHRATGATEYGGHGIGLSVCKWIIERHGGRISAELPLGERGVRIVFSLPAAPP